MTLALGVTLAQMKKKVFYDVMIYGSCIVLLLLVYKYRFVCAPCPFLFGYV